jgi:hypothetical protein
VAGFFRKVAGAFVEFPAGFPEGADRSDGSHPASSDDISALLQQIGSPDPSGGHASDLDEPTDRASRPRRGGPPQGDALAIGPDELFEQAGIADGPNSAIRLMKILAGLGTFPPEQQLAMVRALDAADASWNESSVLGDARSRQAALHDHLDGIEQEHARRLEALSASAREAQSEGDAVIADIDRQIAELQQLRHEALTETAGVVAALDAERREVDAARQRARASVADVSAKLSELIGFFAGHGTAGGGTERHGG